MEKITSAKNPTVQQLRDLKTAKNRRRSGMFLVEGEVMIREAIKCGLNMRILAADEEHAAAWRDTAVCAELPEGGVSECGIQIRLPIWLMCDREDGGVLTVTARVVSASGEEIASGAYTAAAGRVRRAGTLAVDLPPQAGAYIVRCEAQDAQGRVVCRCDETLCVYDEAEPMAALLTLPRATLERAGNAVHNAGAAVAFAEGCALLPGETGDADGEWLNAEIR